MSETSQWWAGDFGRTYTERNASVDWKARIPFWRGIIDETSATSFLEVGCNSGANLKAIRDVIPEGAMISGVDVNRQALDEAKTSGFDVEECEAADIGTIWAPGSAELVFTAGVLIHVAPAELQAVMRAIVEMSSRWVVAVEYDDQTEVEVEYRGHAGRLWRRPYGKLYEATGLSVVTYGPALGFDSCTAWLLEKGGVSQFASGAADTPPEATHNARMAASEARRAKARALIPQEDE